jgi:hypothetical protein
VLRDPLWTGLAEIMGDSAQWAAAPKTCPVCRTEQDADQFYDLRGNGKIVITCLGCRKKKRLNVKLPIATFLLLPLTCHRLPPIERAFRPYATSPVEKA